MVACAQGDFVREAFLVFRDLLSLVQVVEQDAVNQVLGCNCLADLFLGELNWSEQRKVSFGSRKTSRRREPVLGSALALQRGAVDPKQARGRGAGEMDENGGGELAQQSHFFSC